MYCSISRLFLPQCSLRIPLRFIHPAISGKYDQMEFIRTSVLENSDNEINWSEIKRNVLSMQGDINQKNFDGVLLRVMTTRKQYEAALSFADHLKKQSSELALGSILGILQLYSKIGTTRKLTSEERDFILNSYKYLYDKYKILDYTTCEKLLQALCTIDEYEKALKVLEDIYVTSKPSHSTYSNLIGALFRNNKEKKAQEIIKRSWCDKRPLLHCAYNEWINYILRNYKQNKTLLKHLDSILVHIASNYAVIDNETADRFKEIYSKFGWEAEFTQIRKFNGQCIKCKDRLDCLSLSNEEFHTLQQNVKDKLIVGSDLFLKTSPEELKRFLSFVEKTAPYDIVIDALNVAYMFGKGTTADRINFMLSVVNYFKEKNKKILVLGRKHMLKWNRNVWQTLRREHCTFFTEDISQDDPYFITAAILSGPQTDIVSKDLLRTHIFQMKDKNLHNFFKRWQWQHQWMVFTTWNKGIKVQPPLTFTPCAQKKVGWHIPYKNAEAEKKMDEINDGIPDLSSWLCIKPKFNK